MRRYSFPVGWVVANAAGMTLGFLVFLEVLFFLAFGLDFDSHWSTTAVENLENAGRLLPIGLAIGLPLAGGILTCCQAAVLRRRLPSARPWILAGPAGFAFMILLVWPLSHLGIWGDIPGPVEPFRIVGGGLLVTALLQWRVLRRAGTDAARWLVLWIAGLPLGIGVAVATYFLLSTLTGLSLPWAGEIVLIGSLVGGTAAALSGNALLDAIRPRRPRPAPR